MMEISKTLILDREYDVYDKEYAEYGKEWKITKDFDYMHEPTHIPTDVPSMWVVRKCCQKDREAENRMEALPIFFIFQLKA